MTGTNSVSIDNGVVTIELPSNVLADGDGIIRNAATTKLQEIFGVSAWSLADHVMYCMPDNAMTDVAYAYVNSWLSVYNDDWCNKPSAQVHELGHNLNLAHSGEGTNVYGDQSGMVS
jgi:hypothetical protein